MSFKVAVLGPIPRDTIVTHGGEKLSKYGCVLYTAAVLSSLLGDEGEVVPVSHVQRHDAGAIHELLAQLPRVTTTHVTDDEDSGNVIELIYSEHNRRKERQTGFMAPIVEQDVADLMDCDAFVFVPVTDFEVSLDVLRTIKANSTGLVILDGHGPTTTATRHGERHFQFWLDRDQWLPHIDVLKMNLEEAACTWFESAYETAELEARRDGHDLPLDQLPKLAEHCLDQGLSALCVTLDEYGCVVYFRDDEGTTREEFVKRIQVDDVVDTTGCGDSFAGGFAFGLLRTGDHVEACKFGNAAGAQRAAAHSQFEYASLEATERQILTTYGPRSVR